MIKEDRELNLRGSWGAWEELEGEGGGEMIKYGTHV